MGFRDFASLADDLWKWWIYDGFCVTFVRGTSSSHLLDLIGADVAPEVVIGQQDLGLARPDTSDSHFVGVTDALQEWTVIVETRGGYLGASTDIVGPVAARHDVVAILGAKGRYSFERWVDGVLEVRGDPRDETAFSSPWSGAESSHFKEVWRSVVPADSDGAPGGLATAQALFAAAELFTGVSVTEQFSMSAEFTTGTVPKRLPAVPSEFTARLRDADWDARTAFTPGDRRQK